VMAEVRKTRARDEADVTRPDHCDPHTHLWLRCMVAARRIPGTSQ
jgi:hypothetical protein